MPLNVCKVKIPTPPPKMICSGTIFSSFNTKTPRRSHCVCMLFTCLAFVLLSHNSVKRQLIFRILLGTSNCHFPKPAFSRPTTRQQRTAKSPSGSSRLSAPLNSLRTVRQSSSSQYAIKPHF